MIEPTPDWEDLQPRLAELVKKRSLASVKAEIHADGGILNPSKASVSRWARGEARPYDYHARIIARVVARHEIGLRRPR